MSIFVLALSIAAAQQVEGPAPSPPIEAVEEAEGEGPAAPPVEAASPPPATAETPPSGEDSEAAVLADEPGRLLGERRERLLSRRSTGPDLWRTLAGTLVVVLLAVGTLWAIRRFGRGSRWLGGGGALEVLSRRMLDGQARLYLVRVGRRMIVVGATRERMGTLSEIRDPDEVAAIRSEVEGPSESQRKVFPLRLSEGLRAYERLEEKGGPDPLESVERELVELRKKVESWQG